jgi:hypothetical protein
LQSSGCITLSNHTFLLTAVIAEEEEEMAVEPDTIRTTLRPTQEPTSSDWTWMNNDRR